MRYVSVATPLLVAACGITASCGKVQEEDPSSPLAKEEIELHNAPVPDEECPLVSAGEELERISIEFPANTVPPDSLIAASDACGNIVAAWSGPAHTSVVRILADGTEDWFDTFQKTGEEWHSVAHSIVTDEFGSIFVAAREVVLALAANGERHPDVPNDYPLRSHFLGSSEGRYYAGCPGYGELALPSLRPIWSTDEFDVSVIPNSSEVELGCAPFSPQAWLSVAATGAAVDLGDVRGPGGSTASSQIVVRKHSSSDDTRENVFERDMTGQIPSSSVLTFGDDIVWAGSSDGGGDDNKCTSAIEWVSNELTFEVPQCWLSQDLLVTEDGVLFSLWRTSDETPRLRLFRWDPDDLFPTEVDLRDAPTIEPNGNEGTPLARLVRTAAGLWIVALSPDEALSLLPLGKP